MALSALSDPLVWRGIERMLIALGATIFAVLGFYLYKLGITERRGNVKVESKFLSFALSGTGPGLAFMAFGAVVLVAGLVSGGASRETTETAGKGASVAREVKWLYSVSADECSRLVDSPDAALPSALKTARMPWAPRLAERISDVHTLRTVVEAICSE